MFRNRELRQFAVVFFCIAAVTVRMGFALGIKAGLLSVFRPLFLGRYFFRLQKPGIKGFPVFRNRSTRYCTIPDISILRMRRRANFLFCKVRLPR